MSDTSTKFCDREEAWLSWTEDPTLPGLILMLLADPRRWALASLDGVAVPHEDFRHRDARFPRVGVVQYVADTAQQHLPEGCA